MHPKNNYNTLQVLVHLVQLLKKDFIALKAEFGKSDNNKLANVHNSLNNLKTKVNNLDIDKLTSRQTSFEKRKIKHTKNQKI